VFESVSNITETVQEQLPLSKPAPQSVLSGRAQERITNLAANISNRFDGIIARLENIHDRLETRIIKLEESGADVSQARQSLNKSSEAIDRARGELRGIDEAVAYVVGSPDPKTAWQQVRLTFISARTEVRTAHTELRNTVANLKNIQPATTAN
jgi:exonuclease VII small subunit